MSFKFAFLSGQNKVIMWDTENGRERRWEDADDDAATHASMALGEYKSNKNSKAQHTNAEKLVQVQIQAAPRLECAASPSVAICPLPAEEVRVGVEVGVGVGAADLQSKFEFAWRIRIGALFDFAIGQMQLFWGQKDKLA